MPKKLSIEVVCHSDKDVRIVVNDNGLVRRERWKDGGVLAMESLHQFLTNSHVHKECVFFEDEDGNRWPCDISEWYRLHSSVD